MTPSEIDQQLLERAKLYDILVRKPEER